MATKQIDISNAWTSLDWRSREWWGSIKARLAVDVVGPTALVSLGVYNGQSLGPMNNQWDRALRTKMHARLTLHPDDAVHRALVVVLAVALVREEHFVDVVGIVADVLPAGRSLRGHRSDHQHHQCWRNFQTKNSIKFLPSRKSLRCQNKLKEKKNWNSAHQLHKLFAHSISF